MEQMNSNKLVEKYEPLINKLVNQYSKKSKYSWTEIKSMAYEGFALAISKYDEKRSDMDFTKYAAFAIRNAILTGLEGALQTMGWIMMFLHPPITPTGTAHRKIWRSCCPVSPRPTEKRSWWRRPPTPLRRRIRISATIPSAQEPKRRDIPSQCRVRQILCGM